MWYVCALRLRDLGDGQVSYFTSLRRWISRKWQKISSAASLGLLAALAAVVWYTCHQVPQFYHCCPRKDSKDSTESRTITARTFGLESGSPTPVPPMCQDLLAVQKAINMSGASQYVLWFSVFFSRGLNMVKVQRLSYAGMVCWVPGFRSHLASLRSANNLTLSQMLAHHLCRRHSVDSDGPWWITMESPHCFVSSFLKVTSGYWKSTCCTNCTFSNSGSFGWIWKREDLAGCCDKGRMSANNWIPWWTWNRRCVSSRIQMFGSLEV